MYFKKYFILSLASVAGLIAALGIYFVFTVFYNNPLQNYAKGYFDISKYHYEIRSQAPGIIRNIDFDSVILGTSVMENTSALEASNILHRRFINLSVKGANFYERSVVLDYLLTHKKIKNIIYTVDQGYVKLRDYTHFHNKWETIYDSNPWNDLALFYEREFIRTYLSQIWKKEERIHSDLTFFDRPNAWFQSAYQSVKFGGLQQWVKSIEKVGIGEVLLEELPEVAAQVNRAQHPPMPITDIKKYIAYIDKYLLKYVKEYPETTFQLIFPPYYRYVYAKMRQVNPKDFSRHQQVIRYLVKQAQLYKNIEIYGFEDQDFVNDIARYRDTGHYDEPINSYITQSIAKKTHMLTPENVEAYLARCEKLALAFDIVTFNDEAQRLIELHSTHKKY